MNCEPCNSLEITCNHNVTIGYLKELVAIIPDACCTKITVSGNDSYCPTYGELTNGSIIPYFSDGGTNAWSNNVDGITINGGYSNNQCVAKKDLKLIYTAFESLTVANSSPVVSECGGATTTTRTLTFRKYTKECDKASTSTTQTDTTLRVTWSGTDSSSTGTKTYSRNTSFSDTHASTVSCSISWRGCSHTSNSISVSQKVRAFDHNVDYSRSAGESVDVYCYPWDFNCDGGTSYASATYYYTTWTERHYIDTCGVDYSQENINYSYHNTYDVSEYLNATSHSYEKCTVTTASASRFNFTATYDGFSDSDYCQMECSGGCETCPPTDYTEYDDVTASCSDLSATVYGTAHTFSGGALDGEGKCTGYTETTASTSYYVSWSCDTSGGWVDSHVYVTDAPCCSTGTVYTYGEATIPCDSGTNVVASTTYTATTYHKDGTTTTETGSTSCTISNVECNSGSERELSTDCPFTVKQSGGCTCTAPCECTALTLASTTASVTVGSTTDVTFTAGCTTSHTVASSDNTVATATIGNGKVTITGVKAGTATITLSYTAGTTSCSSAITTTVADPTPTCTCDNFAISPTSLEWEASSTASKEVSITESGSCISGVQVSSSNSHFTASISGDKITVTPTAATSSSEETGTLTVSYKANGSDCTPSKTVSLRHKATTCTTATCTCYVVGPATLKTGTSIASGATTAEVEWSYTAVTWTTASTCDVSSSTTTSTSSHTVTGIPTNNTCGDIERTGSFTWTGYKACDSYSSCTNTDATVYWSVMQDRGKSATDPECTGCYCSGFTITSTPSAWNCDETDEREASYSGDCHTDVSASVNNNHFTVSVDATNKKIKVKPSGKNTTNANISATVTVSYKANGSDCTSKTFNVTHNSGTTCYCPDDCTSITAFTINSTIGAAAQTSWTSIGSYGYNAACSDKVSVDSNQTWLSVSAHSGTVYGKWEANTSFTNDRSATVTAKWNGTSCTSRTATTTQRKAECTCSNFTAETVTTAFTDNTGGTITVFKIKHSCGSVEALSASCDSRITSVSTASTTDGTEIKATATANTGSSDVTCVVGYRFKPNSSSSCTSGSTTVKLPGKPAPTCKCSALTLSDTSVSVNAGASTSVTYSADCVSITSIAASSTGITIDTGTTGTIKITGNTSGDYTITIKSSADGTTCTDKTISVKVNCGTIAISPKDSSGDSSGSTVNFSATYTP